MPRFVHARVAVSLGVLALSFSGQALVRDNAAEPAARPPEPLVE